jgi:DNA-binding FadR family transcriptional regulator
MTRTLLRSPARPTLAVRNFRPAGHAQIAAVLGSEILSGARQPGSRMPSVGEMHEQFGVSRVVMREVTKTLAAKGMVTSKTRVGTLVADPSSWNWLDPEVLGWRMRLGLDREFLGQIADVRRAVEPAAAALAARHHTRKDLAGLRAAAAAMHAAEGNYRHFADADLAFHVAIGMISRNPLFRSLTAVIEVALSGILDMTSVGAFAEEKTHGRSAARHEKIVDAIEAGDEQSAAKAMMRVIDEGLRHASGHGILPRNNPAPIRRKRKRKHAKRK